MRNFQPVYNYFLLKTVLLELFFVILTSYVGGQDLKLPKDFEKIIYSSTVHYVFKEDASVKPTNIPSILANDLYLEKDSVSEKVSILQYSEKETPKLRELRTKGDNFLREGRKEKAIKFYEKALSLYPENALLMSSLGAVFYQLEDYKQAKEWCNKALKTNKIHYPAYLILADIYLKASKPDEAADAVTMAHLYNRNDPAILTKLAAIYEINGKLYDGTWQLEPQYAINSPADKEVTISYHTLPWKYYATCRAVWSYEPFYTKKMTWVDDDLLLLEQKECLLNFLVGYEEMKEGAAKKSLQAASKFKEATEKNVIDAFIWYEFFLKQQPDLAFSMEREQIKQIKAYLPAIRCTDKVQSRVNIKINE